MIFYQRANTKRIVSVARPTCVQELRNLIKAQDEKIVELQRSVGDANYQLTEYRREISILKVSKDIVVLVLKLF